MTYFLNMIFFGVKKCFNDPCWLSKMKSKPGNYLLNFEIPDRSDRLCFEFFWVYFDV